MGAYSCAIAAQDGLPEIAQGRHAPTTKVTFNVTY
jgi:hypothetical protein